MQCTMRPKPALLYLTLWVCVRVFVCVCACMRGCVYIKCNLNLSPSAHSSLSGHSKRHVLHRLRRMGLSNELFLVLISCTRGEGIYTHNLYRHPMNRNRPGPIAPTHFEETDKNFFCNLAALLMSSPAETPRWGERSFSSHTDWTNMRQLCLQAYLHMISWVNRTRHISGFLSWPS